MRSARAPGASYGLYAGEAMWPQGLSDEMRTQLLQVPDSIPSEIHALAAELAEGNTMPLTKAAAVTEFFHSNFEYQLGIKIPQDSDPMTYFLLERPPAHCEYFASGAALLLRMAGVPCRYVTGFVAVERNESGGYWMARNRDAHAWVEAYDPVLGWFVVEATPAAGVPDGNEASRWAYMWDGFKHRLTRIRQAFTIPGLIGWTKRIASSLLHAVTTNPVVAFCIVILVASAVVITRRRRVWSPHREDDVDPTRASLRRLLAQVDQRLLKKGIFRNATETLHGYVRRLRTEHTHDIVATTAAEWYLNYARLIYGGHPTRTDIEQLQREIP